MIFTRYIYTYMYIWQAYHSIQDKARSIQHDKLQNGLLCLLCLFPLYSFVPWFVAFQYIPIPQQTCVCAVCVPNFKLVIPCECPASFRFAYRTVLLVEPIITLYNISLERPMQLYYIQYIFKYIVTTVLQTILLYNLHQNTFVKSLFFPYPVQ